MSPSPIHPGKVDWTGENPGIYLKETPDGDWVSLMCFFRITWSPHGVGHALVLLANPASDPKLADRPNVCLTDNEPMARWLVEEFMSNFASFKDRKAVREMPYRPLEKVWRSGDCHRSYSEHVVGSGLDVTLTWSELGEPFAVDMPPEKSATGRHEMYSLFLESTDAYGIVNGQRLPGRPMPRDFAGRNSSTAFLAFSESWIRAV
ncbi:MAG: hypothetical protein WDO24_10130 [Pseudomonadota bacterium]